MTVEREAFEAWLLKEHGGLRVAWEDDCPCRWCRDDDDGGEWMVAHYEEWLGWQAGRATLTAEVAALRDLLGECGEAMAVAVNAEESRAMNEAEEELGPGARWAYERFMRPSILTLRALHDRIQAHEKGV